MTILSESTRKILNGSVIGGIVLVFALVAFAYTIFLLVNEYYKAGLVSFAITIALFVIMVNFFIESHRRIKVILADDYPAIELLDKYTVDGNEGEIWTLTEREPLEEQEDER